MQETSCDVRGLPDIATKVVIKMIKCHRYSELTCCNLIRDAVSSSLQEIFVRDGLSYVQARIAVKANPTREQMLALMASYPLSFLRDWCRLGTQQFINQACSYYLAYLYELPGGFGVVDPERICIPSDGCRPYQNLVGAVRDDVMSLADANRRTADANRRTCVTNLGWQFTQATAQFHELSQQGGALCTHFKNN